MKIQNLITLGVILYIIFSIRKALKFGKKETRKGTAAPNWKDKLQDIANQIKDEIEKANRQNSPEIPPPIPVPSPVDPYVDPYADDIQDTWVSATDGDNQTILDSVDSVQPESPQPVLVVKKKPSVKRSRGVHGSPPLNDPQKPGVTPPGKRQTMSRKPLTLQQKKALRNLRRAVIWTEILSKPVSLRE
jgi:hypothetical protein